MRKVLIFSEIYLPGYRDGGPSKSVENLVDVLGDDYKFYIVCRDRDIGETEPYHGVRLDRWNCVGKAEVFYVRPGGFSFRFIKDISRSADVIYLCGFFSDYGYKSLFLNRIGLLKKKLVLAPMGLFSEGALKQKHRKKKLFIFLAKTLGFFNNVLFSVTSEIEAGEVKKAVGDIHYVVAGDIPRRTVPGRVYGPGGKAFRIIFLSRIVPQKNMLCVIKSLKKTMADIQFNIYGPIEDKGYWERCLQEMETFPPNIKWKYHGAVHPDQVQKAFQDNDVFLFPTLGENYGHVIFEALSTGCIPVISSQTPWGYIEERNAGYVIAGFDPEDYARKIDGIISMDLDERKSMIKNCIDAAAEAREKARDAAGYKELFGF